MLIEKPSLSPASKYAGCSEVSDDLGGGWRLNAAPNLGRARVYKRKYRREYRS